LNRFIIVFVYVVNICPPCHCLYIMLFYDSFIYPCNWYVHFFICICFACRL